MIVIILIRYFSLVSVQYFWLVALQPTNYLAQGTNQSSCYNIDSVLTKKLQVMKCEFYDSLDVQLVLVMDVLTYLAVPIPLTGLTILSALLTFEQQ